MKKLQTQLQAEYAFAEEKIHENRILVGFINSDEELMKKYEEYIKEIKAASK